MKAEGCAFLIGFLFGAYCGLLMGYFISTINYKVKEWLGKLLLGKRYKGINSSEEKS